MVCFLGWIEVEVKVEVEVEEKKLSKPHIAQLKDCLSLKAETS